MHSHLLDLNTENALGTETNPFFLLMYVTGLWLMLPGLMIYFLAPSLYYGALVLSNKLFKELARLTVLGL